jgi:hypothetical protein
MTRSSLLTPVTDKPIPKQGYSLRQFIYCLETRFVTWLIYI